jgi:hypothetical protein
MEVGGYRHASTGLPPGMTPYLLYRRLGEPQGRPGWVRENSPQPGFDPRTIQPAASLYTDYAILAHVCWERETEKEKRSVRVSVNEL